MSKYIAHYGVKGMKWRKKNAVETHDDREKASPQNFESYRRYKKDTLFKKKINAKKEYIRSLKNKRKNNLITRAAYRTKMTKAIYDIKSITNAMNSINKKKPARKVSREYLEELEYNSRRNNF